jgi:DNA-binding MarR family transcriptional regulator
MTQPSYQNGLLFTRAHQAVRARIYSILDTYDLTPSLWAILGAACNAPEGIRLASVAKQMEVKAPLVTMLAAHLLEQGLINRLPHHTDKRAKLLVATPKGKKLAVLIEDELNREIATLMQGVNGNEAKAFQKTLETIISNAQNPIV